MEHQATDDAQGREKRHGSESGVWPSVWRSCSGPAPPPQSARSEAGHGLYGLGPDVQRGAEELLLSSLEGGGGGAMLPGYWRGRLEEIVFMAAISRREISESEPFIDLYVFTYKRAVRQETITLTAINTVRK